MSLKKIMPVALMLAAGGFVAASTETAEAQVVSVPCTPVAVAINGSGNKSAQIQCSSGTWYYGFNSDPDSGGACVGVGMDTVKTMVSVAQTAMLAGKGLRLTVENTSTSCISNVRICSGASC